MDQHDRELLDKQLRTSHRPPLQSGLVATAVVVIFLAGIIVGTLLTRVGTPQNAANGPAMAFLDTGAPITRN